MSEKQLGKRVRFGDDGADNGGPSGSSDLPERDPKIARMLEEADDLDVVELMDESSLRRVLSSFKEKIERNMAERLQYASEPEKFLDSELQVHGELQKLHALAATPELYPLFVQLGGLHPVLELLTHPNSDIAVDAIELWNELLDVEGDDEDTAYAGVLVTQAIELNLLELLVQSLAKLDHTSEDEAKGIYQLFSVLEKILTLPGMSNMQQSQLILIEKTPLVKCCLDIAKTKGEWDTNRLYGSEILSILACGPCRQQFCALLQSDASNGLEALMRTLSYYRKRDPSVAEEREFVANIFDILVAFLTDSPERQNLFREMEGFELLIILMRSKLYAQFGSLKALVAALQNNVESCKRFVDSYGLKALFSMFMQKKRRKESKMNREESASVPESAIHILWTLFCCLPRIEDVSYYHRLCQKFVEKDFEKIGRLFEVETQFKKKLQKLADDDVDDGDEDGLLDDVGYEARYLECLEVSQKVGGCLLSLLLYHSSLEKHISAALEKQERSAEELRKAVEGIARLLDSTADDNSEEATVEMQRTLELLKGSQGE